MTRGLAAVTLLFALCICLCGCGGKKPADSQEDTPTQSASETETAQASQPTQSGNKSNRPVEDPNRDDPHIFDEMGLLSAQDVRALSDAADALAQRFAIHTAVVMTEELEGKSPAKFAAHCYETRYPKGSSGFLVLINNETGEDFVFTSGACTLYFEQSAIDLAVAQATPMLVEGKFREGIAHLLTLGEQMPGLVYDSMGILSREQFDAFLATAQEIQSETKKRCGVLLIDSIEADESQDKQDVLREFAKQRKDALQTDSLLVIAVNDGSCAVAGSKDESLDEELAGILRTTKRFPVTATVNTYYEKMK